MEMIHLEPPQELAMPVGEAIFTQRAIRRFKSDQAISDTHIKTLLDAASKAPNGGNTQPARYLVVRSREKIHAFGALYHEAWWAKRWDEYGWTGKDQIPQGSVYVMPAQLADEMVDAPLVMLAFSVTKGGASSVIPGVQNMMLAARTLGIGSVYTTLHEKVMERVYAMFEVPAEMEFHACIPFGFPRGNFGPTRRLPSAETTYWDKWEGAVPWQRPPVQGLRQKLVHYFFKRWGRIGFTFKTLQLVIDASRRLVKTTWQIGAAKRARNLTHLAGETPAFWG